MSSRQQRREQEAKEIKAGQRLKDGTLPANASGRPSSEIRCLHCHGLLMKIPPRTPRWRLKGIRLWCDKCRREVTL